MNTGEGFDLPKDTRVKLVIYDILGREISTIIDNKVLRAGRRTTEFNGAGLASGVYFYRITAGEFASVKRMVMIK